MDSSCEFMDSIWIIDLKSGVKKICFWFVDHISGFQKICFESWITNPDFKMFVLNRGPRIQPIFKIFDESSQILSTIERLNPWQWLLRILMNWDYQNCEYAYWPLIDSVRGFNLDTCFQITHFADSIHKKKSKKVWFVLISCNLNFAI